VGVLGEKQWPVDARGGAVFADRLCDGRDVVVVETRRQRGTTVPGRTERDALRRIRGVGMLGVIRRDQASEG